MKSTFFERVETFFWWGVMWFAWFIGIFNNKVYEHNNGWLLNYSKKASEKQKI